jgi:hypothetical protein
MQSSNFSLFKTAIKHKKEQFGRKKEGTNKNKQFLPNSI